MTRREQYRHYRKLNVCPDCAVTPPEDPHFARCLACRAKKRTRKNLLRASREAKKLCKGCGKEVEIAQRKYCLKCNDFSKAKYTNNALYYREATRVYRGKLKREVIEAYGGRCYCCNESNLAFLNIDHINNDGYIFREYHGVTGGSSTYLWLKRNNYPQGVVQVACFNCNIARSQNSGICPHHEQELLKAVEPVTERVM